MADLRYNGHLTHEAPTMAFPQRRVPLLPAEVTSNPDIIGGWPCVSGTRIPAMTIVAELRAGTSELDIFDGYPSLPVDGIDAVRKWAEDNGISLDPGATDDPFSD
jgi:uncharacterized protein (DUF433 family)